MSDTKRSLERVRGQFPPPEHVMESLRRRRDRKRRNQRILAGSVGIAVFAAAVWVVTSVGSLNRSETPVVPGGGDTGPAVTGPVTSGPAVTGPIIGDTGDPFAVGFEGLPPEGTAPSDPPTGELVLSEGGIHPGYAVNVYADGRLIWTRGRPGHCCGTSVWIEQRLTPEGVELLRSGAVELGGHYENPGEQLPVSAWEDPELRPYVPSRYAICPWGWPMRLQPPDPEFLGLGPSVVSLVPPAAQDLLRDAEVLGREGDCRDVTLEQARSIGEVLTDAGYAAWGSGSGTVMAEKDKYVVTFDPILPDGGYGRPVGG